MNALDIAARGLAGRALQAGTALASTAGAAGIGTADGATVQEIVDETRDGSANLRARTASTAAATEALSAQFAALTGYAGDTHTVETAPYLLRDHLVIQGNGAELRNVNTTPLEIDDIVSVALPLGSSHVYATDDLTYYPVLSTSGLELTVAEGTGANFSAGDLVVVHGATKYVGGGDYEIYRNYARARVVSATATTITLDRMLTAELQADAPVIANSGEGMDAGIPGPPRYYLLFAPHISNITLASDMGSAWKWGGVIDGTFRDIRLTGRNGIVFNAMQDCLFDNIRFLARRKICELAEGSCGTTIRKLHGSLTDAGTDRPGFFIGIHENSAECVIEDINVSSGPNTTIPATGSAVQLGSGRSNVIRKGVLRFPNHTGAGLSIQSNSTPGSPVVDCGYEMLDVYLPNGSVFLSIGDAGAGVIRPFARDIKFFGSVSSRAVNVVGNGGTLDNVWCEDGGVLFTGTTTNWTIRNCFFPDGFENLTRDRLATNRIYNNESDASRRIAAAAIVSAAQATVSSTTANNPVHTLTIAPGDLKTLDEVHFKLAGAVGNESNVHHVRVTCRIDGSIAVEIAHMTTATPQADWIVEGTVEVQANSIVHATTKVLVGSATTGTTTRTTGGNLDTNGLVLVVEMWTETSGSVTQQLAKLAGQKAGMRNVPVFA